MSHRQTTATTASDIGTSVRWRRRAIGIAAVGLVAAVATLPGAAFRSQASAPASTPLMSLSDPVSIELIANAQGGEDVHVFGFNDFHGNLEAPTGGNGRIGAVNAGGAEYLATTLKQLRATSAFNVTVAAGDNIGASPLLSSLFREESAIEALNAMGVDIASVGNHEFDKGSVELQRLQNGGCHADGCVVLNRPFTGAKFQYTSANVVAKGSTNTLFPPYVIKTFAVDPANPAKNIKIAFVGETTRTTPQLVTPTGVASLDFLDEADAANALVPALRAQGVNAMVLVIHEGGAQDAAGTFNTCSNLSGEIVNISRRLDPAYNVIISGHTHNFYNCVLNNRVVTSASSFGRLVSDVNMSFDSTGKLAAVSASNVIVQNSNNAGQLDPTKADPAVKAIVDFYRPLAAPLANRVIGSLSRDIVRAASATGESPLGNLIADSQLEATAPAAQGGAVLALMNPGGVRADLSFTPAGTETRKAGELTYGMIFTVQPFGNNLTTMTVTGKQLLDVLEQQFAGALGQTTTRILQPSRSLTYAYDPNSPPGQKLVRSTVRVNGTVVSESATYRITVNSFLAAGGDGFTVFTGGTNVLGGQVDLDAFEEYVKRNPALSPPALGRILHGSNLPPTAGAFIVTTPTTTLAPATTAAPTTTAAATTTTAATTTAVTTTTAAVTTTAATTTVPASATIAPTLEAEPAAESDAEVSFTG